MSRSAARGYLQLLCTEDVLSAWRLRAGPMAERSLIHFIFAAQATWGAFLVSWVL